MPKKVDEILLTIATKAEWSNGLLTKEQITEPYNSKSSFKYFIAKNAFHQEPNDELSIDAIYFNDIAPVINIKKLNEFNNDKIIELQSRFWNEGRTPISLVITPKKILVLDNYAKPENAASNFVLKEFTSDEDDLTRLSNILSQSKLDSEKVIGNSLNVKIKQRVDKKLISQLRSARQILHNDFKLDFSTIHDLLGRSLFTLYLEHRNILTAKDIKLETGKEVDFFELLNSYPSETYKLFEFLKDKFNGDLFPISEKEKNAVSKNSKILNVVYNCFTGETELSSGQLSLFRLFNFKYIPIELISSIYEEFMNEEDNDKGENIIDFTTSKKELGAFYTPQMLVEFVYNEVLPMPSKNDCSYNIKILDPACGSGIFLVEGFKRLIERWKFKHQTEKLTKDNLLTILQNNIFGIELHPEAIKITAFSLYLTFLNYMNPKEILRKVKFESLIFWTKSDNDKDYDKRDLNKVGSNLLRANTFIRETDSFKENKIKEVVEFFDNKFDLIVGNPPWKRDNVSKEITKWAKCNNWEVKKDIVKAFLVYAPTLSKNATIALISSAKVLFNTTDIENKYRKRFFKEHKVSVVVNFAKVSDVLFENAKQAAALLIYKNKNDKVDLSENLIYITPKTKSTIKNRRTVTIDSSEIKYLPLSEILKDNSKIFKIAMYGGLRDLKFVNRLKQMDSIEDKVFNDYKGIGLHIKERKKPFGNNRLEKNYFIPSKKIKRYSIDYNTNNLKKLGESHLNYRTNKKNIFSSPVILLNEGTKDSLFCATLVEFNCAFLKSSYGFKLKIKSKEYHKALVVCLNSDLANYYFIAISSSWGVDRNRIQNNEAISFPIVTEYLTEKSIKELAIIFDKIKSKISGENIFNNLLEVKSSINEIIYNDLKINVNEQILIENVINFSNVIKENYKKCNAESKVNVENDIKFYASTFLDVVNKHFEESNIKLKAEIYTKHNDKLTCVKFFFDKKGDKPPIYTSNANITNILKKINEYCFQEHNSSIYYRRFIKYELKNAFYLIKPNQKRFWTKAIALINADELIAEILTQ